MDYEANRKAKRYPTFIQVYWENNRLVGYFTDISKSGARLLLDKDYNIGEEPVFLNIKPDKKDSGKLKIKCAQRRINETGSNIFHEIGVEFVDVTEEQKNYVENLIKNIKGSG